MPPDGESWSRGAKPDDLASLGYIDVDINHDISMVRAKA
jgi:hypothetical protein